MPLIHRLVQSVLAEGGAGAVSRVGEGGAGAVSRVGGGGAADGGGFAGNEGD